MQIYEPNTCFSNSHTTNNLWSGLLKAFWNGLPFLSQDNWTHRVIHSVLLITLKCSQGAKSYIQKMRICIFSLMGITAWQTQLVICTLWKLSCKASGAHRLKSEHTSCLLVGIKNEDVLLRSALSGLLLQTDSPATVWKHLQSTSWQFKGKDLSKPFRLSFVIPLLTALTFSSLIFGFLCVIISVKGWTLKKKTFWIFH